MSREFAIELLAVKESATLTLSELRSLGYAEMIDEIACRFCGRTYLLFIEGEQMRNDNVAGVFQTDEAVEHFINRISLGHGSGHQPERLMLECALLA
jgi:hypothetical protein